MKKTIRLLLLFLFPGCSFLHMSPLTITEYSPEAGLIENPAELIVTLTFSDDPDKISVEEAFSLKEDGAFISGRFSWQNRTMTFEPCELMQTGHDYLLELTTDAEDRWGNSLDRNFCLEFTSKTENSRPEVVSFTPEDGAVLDTNDLPLEIEFSEAVDHGSLCKAFSISPALRGYFTWTDECNAQYNLLGPVLWNVEYTMHISTELCDMSGNRMNEMFSSKFTASVDDEPPVIAAVEYIWNNGSEDVSAGMPVRDPESADPEITAEFRRDGRIRISLEDESRIDRDAVESACLIIPALTCKFIWQETDEYEQLEIIPEPSEVIWDTVYRLILSNAGDGVCDIYGNRIEDEQSRYFRTDAAWSRPPEVVALYSTTIPLAGLADPANPPDGYYQEIHYAMDALNLVNFDSAGDEGFFDYYLKIGPGPGHSIVLASTFDAFAYECLNNCAVIGSPFRIDIFTEQDEITPPPALPFPETEAQVIVRVHCAVHDNADTSGLVRFIVKPVLKDTAGNVMDGEFEVLVEK
ncbi:MAG: Ig-like domain-containing protein [Spirochaetales bacterium]|nr:Ig-like domain-containing protein [Spirochaetales bacterium]